MKYLKQFFLLVFLFGCITSKAQWNSLGAGLVFPPTNMHITSLVEYNSKLIIAGSFKQTGGYITPNIVAWDGQEFDTITCQSFDQQNFGGVVYSMAVYDNKLFVGGGNINFCNIDKTIGAIRNYIIYYDGSSWNMLPNNNSKNFNGNIYAMIVYKNELYVAGTLYEINGKPFNRIAKWNGTTWKNVGSGITGGVSSISAMAVYNDELYVGGNFYFAGGKPANFLAKWNGNIWDSVDNSLNSTVQSLFTDTIHNRLLLGGGFTNAGDSPTLGIASWDGLKMTPLSNDTLIGTRAICTYKDSIVAGGSNYLFNSDSTKAIKNVYFKDGAKWRTLLGGTNGPIAKMLVWNGKLFIAGSFDSLGNKNIKCIAYTNLNFTGIEEERKSNDLVIYPNPNNGLVYIKDKVVIEKTELFNQLGQLIYVEKSPNNTVIDLSKIDKGEYILHISYRKTLASKLSISINKISIK